MKTVTIGIIAYNEGNNLALLLEKIKEQNYPLNLIESGKQKMV